MFSVFVVFLTLLIFEKQSKHGIKVLNDCAQLVKYNSIEGNRQNNVAIVYTMWPNLKKTGDMDVGQVGFKDHKAVKKLTVARRENEIVNR